VSEPVFELRGVGFAYGPQTVLEGVDLSLAPGCLHGVVGPNGSGKTTLLDLMAGLRPPQSGRVLFLGRPLGDYSGRELARRLALVPQEFAINFPFTVREVVMMGRHPHLRRFASPGPEDLAAVERALGETELGGLAHKPVTALSGGEKQRVVLARALAQQAPVILLDEPTSNLDVNHSLALMAVVQRRVRGEGCTAVVVMHDLNLAAVFCDRLIMLSGGRVFACGPTEEVLTADRLAAVFSVQAQVRQDQYAGGPQVVFRKPEAAR